MKLILVEIKRSNTPGATMQYPPIYNAMEVETHKRGPIVYEGRLARGEDVEHCLICVSDELAEKYATDPGVKIVTKDEANAWLAQNPELQERPSESVDDPNRMLAIIAKKLAGLDLSDEDLAALDPKHPMPGVRKVPKTVEEIFPFYDGP